MSAQLHPTLVICSACGSESFKTSKACWLCHADLATAQPLLIAEVVDESRAGYIGHQIFWWLTVACFAFAIVVGIGIFQTDPGSLIAYCIVVGPAMLATSGRAAIARMQGKSATGPQLFLTFIGSLVAVVGIGVLMVLALIAGLLVLCFRELR